MSTENIQPFSKEWAVAATKEIKQTKENWGYYLEIMELDARKQRARYESLLNQGFTPEQCIELIK